jgi:hypothetical protein
MEGLTDLNHPGLPTGETYLLSLSLTIYNLVDAGLTKRPTDFLILLSPRFDFGARD